MHYVNEFFSGIERIKEESKRKETRLMEVITQYEEELKRVKEELHIYQRRERNLQQSPQQSSPTCSKPAETKPSNLSPNMTKVRSSQRLVVNK